MSDSTSHFHYDEIISFYLHIFFDLRKLYHCISDPDNLH